MVDKYVKDEEERSNYLERKKNKVDKRGEVQKEILISFGRQIDKVCMIKVDGAWKRNVRKDCPSAGIGWAGVLEDGHLFKGNDKIRANSTIQCEGLAVLRGLKEAFQKGARSIRVFTNSSLFVSMMIKRQFYFQMASISYDLYAICNKFNYFL